MQEEDNDDDEHYTLTWSKGITQPYYFFNQGDLSLV